MNAAVPTALTDAAVVSAIESLAAAARAFDARNWSPATSSNYSARVAPDRVVITRSGADKGSLGADDFLLVDLAGTPLTPGQPSAETALHLALYRHDPDIGSVLHTHAPSGVVLSRWIRKKRVLLAGWELQKAFTGVMSHDTRIRVPVFDNEQDMDRVADDVLRRLPQATRRGPCFGFLLRAHGLYAWGADITAARRHVEAFEYLFGCELALARLRSQPHEQPHKQPRKQPHKRALQ